MCVTSKVAGASDVIAARVHATCLNPAAWDEWNVPAVSLSLCRDVHKSSREELLGRLNALSEDALDSVERDEPDGFDLGLVGLVFEVHSEREGSDYLKRSDAGYTPDDDVASYFTTWTSDHRPWVKKMIYEAALSAVVDPDEDDDDDDLEETPEEEQ